MTYTVIRDVSRPTLMAPRVVSDPLVSCDQFMGERCAPVGLDTLEDVYRRYSKLPNFVVQSRKSLHSYSAYQALHRELRHQRPMVRLQEYND